MSALRALALCALSSGLPAAATAAEPADVLVTYADIAAATYGDSLTAAKRLQISVTALIATPSADTMAAARRDYLAARVPYMQSEVFRFGNPIVDDWEGRVNAWPLDEGLIDYVATGTAQGGENDYAALNVVANKRFSIAGQPIDATEITADLLQGTLQEADAVEANVATGYHAIEFLLWGQDLNLFGPGAGQRPWTDYAPDACTNGNCDRRGAYLQVATDLLVSDLAEMVGNWANGGAARAEVLADPVAGLRAMLTGMGSLGYGEQAGQRMKLGLMLNDPEEEHDCFSDNTFNSHYYDGLGIQNIYLGQYLGIDGTPVSGPSLSDLVAADDPALDLVLRGALQDTMAKLGRIKLAAEAGFAYDQMLEPGNANGEALIMAAVDALIAQTHEIERAVAVLGLNGIELEGSDSLDNPDAVFQ